MLLYILTEICLFSTEVGSVRCQDSGSGLPVFAITPLQPWPFWWRPYVARCLPMFPLLTCISISIGVWIICSRCNCWQLWIKRLLKALHSVKLSCQSYIKKSIHWHQTLQSHNFVCSTVVQCKYHTLEVVDYGIFPWAIQLCLCLS